LALVVAVDGPPDAFAESSFSAHMVQHVLLQTVAAPLLLLGGPVSLLLRADLPWLPRRALVRILRSRAVAVLTHPVTALGLFAVVLVATHLTSLYELALEHDPVHRAEHLAYLLTALLFWWPAIGVDPAPHRIGHLYRLLYVMVSMPVPAFLGLAIANAGHVLYASYAQPTPWGASALSDQAAAGTLMWVAGMFTTVPAIGVVLMRWLDDESRRGGRAGGPGARNHLAGAR
jgi:cytochrome c oxidase assembly factor CtaG